MLKYELFFVDQNLSIYASLQCWHLVMSGFRVAVWALISKRLAITGFVGSGIRLNSQLFYLTSICVISVNPTASLYTSTYRYTYTCKVDMRIYITYMKHVWHSEVAWQWFSYLRLPLALWEASSRSVSVSHIMPMCQDWTDTRRTSDWPVTASWRTAVTEDCHDEDLKKSMAVGRAGTSIFCAPNIMSFVQGTDCSLLHSFCLQIKLPSAILTFL